MNKTAVIIPCYNEEKTIGKVVTDFRRELPDADIYVYDNNSTDRSVEIMRELSSDKVHLCFEHRQGKGNVVRRMFREVDADCYIMVDADDTYPAESASVLEKAVLEKDCDMAVGDRLSGTYYTENKRPFHNLGNNLVRDMVNHFFRSNLHDIMTGFRAMSRDFVKTYAVLCEGFEIETDMTIFALDNGFLIKRVQGNNDYCKAPEGCETAEILFCCRNTSSAFICRILHSCFKGISCNGAGKQNADADNGVYDNNCVIDGILHGNSAAGPQKIP